MPDQTPRAQLAAGIETWVNRDWLVLPGPVDMSGQLVEHLAKQFAGWRPPARVVTDRAELNSLPDGTVILDGNEEFHRLNPYGVDGGPIWYPAWVSGNAYAQDFGQDPELPATVVHTPENGDTQ